MYYINVDAVTVVLYNSFNGLTQGSGSTYANISDAANTNYSEAAIITNSVSPVTGKEVKYHLAS